MSFHLDDASWLSDYFFNYMDEDTQFEFQLQSIVKQMDWCPKNWRLWLEKLDISMKQIEQNSFSYD